jgi:hypothetical protein
MGAANVAMRVAVGAGVVEDGLALQAVKIRRIEQNIIERNRICRFRFIS